MTPTSTTCAGCAPKELIERMCMTFRHDFRVVLIEDDVWLGSGMTERERAALRTSMRQIWEHDIMPYVQAALDNAASALREADEFRAAGIVEDLTP